MKQDIIINSTTSETRIALLEDDQLVELFVERPESERLVGSIYKGLVRRVMVGMSAAFIDIGMAQDAFLHFSDMGSGAEMLDDILDEQDNEPNSKPSSNARTGADLKVGEEILVQIVKESIGRKGPRVSSQIALPGRSLVLVPNEDYVGVSRKIMDWKERKRLKSIGAKIRPKGCGLILRTLSENKTEEVLKADLNRVHKTWLRIEKNIRSLKGVGVVYRDLTMASSIIRDVFSPDVNSLVVDSRKLYREIVNYLEDVAPNLVNKIHLFNQREPIFDHYSIETEIEKSLQRKIWLNGGGYIYFDATEALVAIDINSGRFIGKKDHEENSLKVNIKAAREISRQLRLRDIGGLIVIDFIDLAEEKNRRKLFDEMRKAMRMDRAKWDIAPLSPFGLMEMTRQRIRPSLLYTFRESCPYCDGTGTVPSMETVVTAIERWVKRFVVKTRERRVELTVNPQVKTYLSGGLNSRIARIMWNNRVWITLRDDDTLKLSEFKGFSLKENRDVTADFLASKN